MGQFKIGFLKYWLFVRVECDVLRWLNVREASFEVGFFREGAPCSLDDDVGGVVCSLHTMIQWFLLDQLRQETCTTCPHVRIQRTHWPTCGFKIEKWKRGNCSPPTNASPAPVVSTMSFGSIFKTGNVSTLPPAQKINKQNLSPKYAKQNKTWWGETILLWTTVVSSFPWVNTTIRSRFVLTLGKAWAFLAISLMSLV